jgi:hypothetical protein
MRYEGKETYLKAQTVGVFSPINKEFFTTTHGTSYNNNVGLVIAANKRNPADKMQRSHINIFNHPAFRIS